MNAKIARRGDEEKNCSLMGRNNVETFLMGRMSIVISEKAPIRHDISVLIYIYIYINRPFVNRKSFLPAVPFPASLDKERPVS